MKVSFLSHNPDSRRLMVVFAGWSTTPVFYSSVARPGWDVAVVWDYTEPFINLNDFIKGYSTVFVIAWSLGVTVAEHLADCGLLDPDRIASAFAVNGTARPASDDFGIPKTIYDGTEATLNPDNLKRFYRRMATKRDLYPSLPDGVPDSSADIESLRSQLRIIRDMNPAVSLPWHRAYVSEADRIIPADAQRRFWEREGVDIITIPAGHFIPLDMIMHRVTPDIDRIGYCFRTAKKYDDYAGPQQSIAKRLCDFIPDRFSGIDALLEIGTGTGFFSRLAAAKTSPSAMTMVDLYPTPEMGIAPEEHHIAMDAEIFMERCDGNSYDLIVSANTIQWFADLDRFFFNASRSLKNGGALVCSTFLPGNLGELDILRPAPLLYHSLEWIRNCASAYFESVECHTEDLPVAFTSRREMLLHLRHTGVAGSDNRMANPITLLPKQPTLTYRPAYIVAQRSKYVL